MIKDIKVKRFDEDTRVDRWLKRQFTALSQNFIEKNLRKGIITVNSKKIKANYKVIVGDIVNIHEDFELEFSDFPANFGGVVLEGYLLS